METILEQQRRYHEERDRLVKAMVDEFLVKKVSVNFHHSSHNLKINNFLFIFTVPRTNLFRSSIESSLECLYSFFFKIIQVNYFNFHMVSAT